MTTTFSRRAAFGLAAGLIAVTAACGTTSSDSAETATTTKPKAGGCDGVRPAAGTVEVQDSLGRTVKLDGPAKRVAVLEWQQTEDVLSLCLTPVAVADAKGYRLWDTAEELPTGVTDVGTRGEPNLDALFGTNPDLVIVEATAKDDPVIAQLEKYDVPVLATKGADAADPIGTMLATFDLIAEATGRSDRADTVKASFEAATKDAKAKIAAADLDDERFVYVDGYLDGGNVAIRPFGKGSLIADLGEAIGLENAWTGKVDAAYGLGLTDIEGMTAVGDATVFYTSTTDGSSDDVIAALQENPVWKALPAVAQDRIHPFPAGTWTFGGPRSSVQVLDAYVDLLTKTK